MRISDWSSDVCSSDLLWPKQRILEVYLNIAELGPGIYGAEAAAQHYFERPASDLSATQAARLAAILPNPLEWRAQPAGDYVARRAGTINTDRKSTRLNSSH